MEKETIQDLILRYGVILKKRNTEKQKTAFLRAAQKQLEEAGFTVDITCVAASIMKREAMHTYNLYAGDFNHAEIVFVTYYDTPLLQLLPREQKAFASNWSQGNFLLHTLLFLLCILVIVFLLYSGVIPNLQRYGFMSIWGAVLVLVCLSGFYIVRQMRGGMAAGNTMVRNSSSLITLFALASELSEQEKEHVAFALIDEGTRSEYGLCMLQEYIGRRSIQRIYLDSIGNVGQLQGFADQQMMTRFQEQLIKHMNWNELAVDKQVYGEILITSGNCCDGSVPLKIEKRTDNCDMEQQINEAIQVLRELIITTL